MKLNFAFFAVGFQFFILARKISVGMDIGTRHVKVVVGERLKRSGKVVKRILGTGFSESKGLRYGYIINSGDVVNSIKEAVGAAERSAGISIKQSLVSVGGVSLEGVVSNGSVIISRGDSEITDLDVERVIAQSEDSLPQSVSLNRKVVHTVPIQFKIDGKEVLGRPAGMKGVKLEVKTLFITYLEQHLNDLVQAVEEAGIEVIDIVAAPLAAALVNLTKAEKIAGSVLANIGAETVSIVVYENNIPVSLKVFPIGGTDITNDIALGLQIPLEEAEKVKIGESDDMHPRKQLDEIILARLEDIFELIESHLKKIGKSGLLPAGIVLTGGSSSIATIEDLAKAALKLPAARAMLNVPTGKNSSSGARSEIKDSSWSVAYGLSTLGLSSEDEEPNGFRILKSTKQNLISWIKKYLP